MRIRLSFSIGLALMAALLLLATGCGSGAGAKEIATAAITIEIPTVNPAMASAIKGADAQGAKAYMFMTSVYVVAEDQSTYSTY